MNVSRSIATIAVLFAIGLAGLGISAWWAHDAQQRVLRARGRLSECRELAGKILAQRDAPETATDKRAQENELAQRFEAWARDAGLEAGQLERIDPLSPRRLGDTDYLIEGDDIELTGVTLSQLAELARSVVRDDSRLRVSRLRLTSPRVGPEDGAGEERWRVELALTYLRHAPKSSRRR